MTQRVVTTCDGRSIAYLVEPGEDPVLLVHGFGSAAIPTWAATGWITALTDAGRGVIGYSMGSQVCRAFARDAPGRIRRLILGGIGSVEQFSHWGLDAIQAVLLDGRAIADPVADRMLRAALTGPDPDPAALVACAQGVMSDPVLSPPVVPTLVVAGGVDPVAIGAPGFAERIGAEFVSVPKRNHFTTLGSRIFKAAALEFLAR